MKIFFILLILSVVFTTVPQAQEPVEGEMRYYGDQMIQPEGGVDPNKPSKVNKAIIQHKCEWNKNLYILASFKPPHDEYEYTLNIKWDKGTLVADENGKKVNIEFTEGESCDLFAYKLVVDNKEVGKGRVEKSSLQAERLLPVGPFSETSGKLLFNGLKL